jgi:transposase-like protein
MLMNCDLHEAKIGNGESIYYCPRCQRQMTQKSDLKLKRTCKSTVEQAAERELRFGDLAEKMLNSVGITQERYKEAKGWLLGLPPGEVDCFCPQRKEWLNNLGKRFSVFLGLSTKQS